MNILTPVSNAEEIRLFSELGANEFFSGYVNQKWIDDFNSLSDEKGILQLPINRRTPLRTNIVSYEKLKEAVDMAEMVGGRFYITLNAAFYTENMYPYLKEYHYIKRTGSIQHNADINLMVTTAKQFETINLFINGSKLKFVLKPYLNKCFIRRMLFIINKTNIIKPIPIYIPDSLDYLKGKRIVICGAGTIGKDYYIYLSRHHDYNIVMWVDDIPSNYYKERVCPVANIMNCDYDLILIAVEKEDLAIQIRKSLIEQGALPDKIYWKSPRSIIDDEIINDDTI